MGAEGDAVESQDACCCCGCKAKGEKVLLEEDWKGKLGEVKEDWFARFVTGEEQKGNEQKQHYSSWIKKSEFFQVENKVMHNSCSETEGATVSKAIKSGRNNTNTAFCPE